MSLSKISLHPSLRLTAVSLALVLAGCGGNPPVYEPAPTGSTTSSYEPAPSYSEPTSYEPVLERINEPVPLADGAPNEYVVQIGDTLWDISSTFLRDPWFWPEIWYVNPEIENPHLIYPGDVLALVYIDGEPRITNVRASTYRMSPQARVTPLTEAITSIPYEDVAAFLSSGVVLERNQADALPYLLTTRGEHMIASAGNEIYVRGIDQNVPGARYTVVQVGDPLIDPDDNRLIGYQGITVGSGTLRRVGDPSTVALTDTSQEAQTGDRLLPEAVNVPLNFFPRSPSTTVEGRIVSVVGGVTQIGQYQVVVLNRGSNNGVSVGDVLNVWQTGETVKDRVRGGSVRLPDEQAGTIMVFKTYDRISYGLVMEATEAIHVHDIVRNPT
jgi:hypothetical protein